MNAASKGAVVEIADLFACRLVYVVGSPLSTFEPCGDGVSRSLCVERFRPHLC